MPRVLVCLMTTTHDPTSPDQGRTRADALTAWRAEAVKHPALAAALSVMVPLSLLYFQDHGGPDETSREQARATAPLLAEHGDDLLYGGPECASLAAGLARALAVMAYQPGGVTFAGMHWEVSR